jgi:hypothetical protein
LTAHSSVCKKKKIEEEDPLVRGFLFGNCAFLLALANR